MAEIGMQLKAEKSGDTRKRKRMMWEMAGLTLFAKSEDEKNPRTCTNGKKRTSKKGAKPGNTGAIRACTEEDETGDEKEEEKEEFIEDGAIEMKIAVDRLMLRNCEKLSEVLLEKAMGGDLTSTKLLLALAEGKKPRELVNKPPSLGLQWATERQWDPEKDVERYRVNPNSDDYWEEIDGVKSATGNME